MFRLIFLLFVGLADGIVHIDNDDVVKCEVIRMNEQFRL